MKIYDILLPEFSEYAEDSIEAESLEDAAKKFIAENLSQYETSVIFTTSAVGVVENGAEIRVSLPYGAFVDYVISEPEEVE